MGIESGYQDHLAQKDSTMILGARVSIPKRNKNQLQQIRVLQTGTKVLIEVDFSLDGKMFQSRISIYFRPI